MDAITPEIRLDPQAEGVLYEDEDWEMDAHHRMFHKPTHLLFHVAFDDVEDLDKMSLFDFYARVCHVCDGHTLPLSEKIIELGRAAIIVFLIRIGAWKGELIEVDDKIPF